MKGNQHFGLGAGRSWLNADNDWLSRHLGGLVAIGHPACIIFGQDDLALRIFVNDRRRGINRHGVFREGQVALIYQRYDALMVTVVVDVRDLVPLRMDGAVWVFVVEAEPQVTRRT